MKVATRASAPTADQETPRNARKHQETPRIIRPPRTPQDTPRLPKTHQDAPRGPKMTQKSPGCPNIPYDRWMPDNFSLKVCYRLPLLVHVQARTYMGVHTYRNPRQLPRTVRLRITRTADRRRELPAALRRHTFGTPS